MRQEGHWAATLWSLKPKFDSVNSFSIRLERSQDMAPRLYYRSILMDAHTGSDNANNIVALSTWEETRSLAAISRMMSGMISTMPRGAARTLHAVLLLLITGTISRRTLAQ